MVEWGYEVVRTWCAKTGLPSRLISEMSPVWSRRLSVSPPSPERPLHSAAQQSGTYLTMTEQIER